MTSEQNKIKYRQFIEEAWNKGNLAVVDEIASPDLTLHFMPPGTPPGAGVVKKFIESTRKAFPDITFSIIDEIEDGDKIVTRYLMTGTHTGPYLNHLQTLMPPTGKKISAEGIDICRFDSNGKWVDCWGSLDRLGMLRQLGALP